MGVRAEPTPNPNAFKFTTDQIIFDSDTSISVMQGNKSEHAILNDLMQLEGVHDVFGYKDFITVNKVFDALWDDITPHVISVMKSYGY